MEKPLSKTSFCGCVPRVSRGGVSDDATALQSQKDSFGHRFFQPKAGDLPVVLTRIKKEGACCLKSK
ncbi:MAG TPA: hypothetical protein VNQ90_18520 [Chthoniobacteraceae bacterium]|nr:hypothetical protein [Chthoniobacteraceae bacterium]